MSSKGLTEQKLNFILAICAVLISIASFYATFLQASAAEKQVKAMTLPLLQYETANIDTEVNEPIISFTIKNGGVGPALIRNLSFNYNDESNLTFFEFLNSCCESEFKMINDRKNLSMDLSMGGYITSTIQNTVLPAQQDIKFFRLYPGELGAELWSKLDKERFKLSVSVCYCSLLDECYLTNGIAENVPVDSCPLNIQ